MKKNSKSVEAAEKLSKQEQAAQPAKEMNTQRLIHDLEVHEIELEAQGEELTQARAELEAALRQYTDLYDFAPVGYFTLTRDSTIRQANLAGANLLGVKHHELSQRRLGVFVASESRPAFNVFLGELSSGEGKKSCELKFEKKGDGVHWARLEATCFEGGDVCRAMLTDITERKQAAALLQARVRISEFVESHTFDELLQKALDEAEALTGSQVGFAHFLEADQKTLQLQMWSTNTLKNMCAAEGKGSHYSVEEAGVWAECVSTRSAVIHNDYPNLPASRRKGLPQGHAPILREIVVPVLRNNLIVMITGVGNKSTDYDDNDVETLSQLANSAWEIVQRKRAEDALKKSEKKYRLLHESIIDGFVSVDMNGNFLDSNETYRNMLGYSQTELAQITYFDLTPEKWYEFEADIVNNQILKRGYSDIYQKEYRRKDGSIFAAELRTILLRDEQENPAGMWAIVRDITERKQAEQALRAAGQQWQDTFDAIGDSISLIDTDWRIIKHNCATQALLGKSAAEINGHNCYEIMHGTSQPIENCPFQRMKKSKRRESLVLELNGRWLSVTVDPIFNSDGQLVGGTHIASDITERKHAEEALRENQELFTLFMHHSPIYAFIKAVTHDESRVLQASDNYLQMIGISGQDMMGKTMTELFPPEFAAKITADDWAVISNGQVLKLDEELNGRHYTSIKFPIVQGDKSLLAGYTIDITEQVRTEKALEAMNRELQTALLREQELADTDMLTSVNNRRRLYELAELEFEIAVRYQQPLSIIMFDIDHFKRVNDTFGHAAGDQILQHVAQVANTQLRAADIIGRYGGEEFVIVLPMTSAAHAYPLAERLRQEVEALRVPTEKGDAAVTISIGIVEMSQNQPTVSVENLIRRADEAMYTAKQAGRNQTKIGN